MRFILACSFGSLLRGHCDINILAGRILRCHKILHGKKDRGYAVSSGLCRL